MTVGKEIKTMKHTYGFIGCGNMGGALARAAVKAVSSDQILIAEKDEAKAAAFAQETGVSVGESVAAASECKYIFLGVKPQMLEDMFAEIRPVLVSRSDRFILVSMAAGISSEKIQKLSGGDYPVIRIMPNIPASVGEGMILYCTKGNVEKEELEEFLHLMSKTGRLCRLDEKLIDAGSAVSGCGPAFAFMFIEALADGGVQCGLPRDKAVLLSAQTLLGSAALLLETGSHPGVLKDAVCSPGGTTIAGVHALEKGAFRSSAAEAVLEAYKRTLEMGK